MAKANVKTIVNVGTTQLSGAVFSVKNGGLVLEQFETVPLICNFSDDQSWIDAMLGAFQSLSSRLRVKGEIVMIAPAHALITKNSKIPEVVDESRRDEVYAFEAESQFSSLFPLSELVWGAQSINHDGIEEELILFAMKKEQANGIVEQAKEVRWLPKEIRPCTLLDIQLYKFAELVRGETADLSEATDVILNVGARTTNMTVVDENGFTVSNIALGGNYVTQCIAEAQGLDFVQAEKIKLEALAEYAATGAFPKGNVGGTVAAACDKFVRRLVRDVSVRLVSLKKRNPVSRVITMGRGSFVPGLEKTFLEVKKWKVYRVNIEDLFTIAPGVPSSVIEENLTFIREPLAVASEMLDPSAKPINLLPKEIVEFQKFKRQVPWYIAGALLFAAAPWLALFEEWQTLDNITANSKAQDAAIKRLTSNKAQIEGISNHISKVREYVEKMDTILDTRYNWNSILQQIQDTLDDLHSRVVKDEFGDPVPASDRFVWIESMYANRSMQEAKEATGDEEAVPAKVISELVVTFRFLIPELDGVEPSHNNKLFTERLEAIRAALREHLKAAADPEGKWPEVSEMKQANLPAVTFTIRLKEKEEI